MWESKVIGDNLFIDTFRFTAGEIDQITSLVSFAGRMHAFKALPPFIQKGNLKILFDEEGKMDLLRLDEYASDKENEVRGGRVKFSFDQTTDLVQIIQSLASQYVSESTLRSRPNSSNTVKSIQGDSPDIFDGVA